MNRVTMLAIFSVIVTFITAAANAKEADFQPSTYTHYKQLSPHKGEVEVLMKIPTDSNYIELGTVRVSMKDFQNIEDAMEALKAESALHGGNAIVIFEDAKLIASGSLTDRGTVPENATAIALKI